MLAALAALIVVVAKPLPERAPSPEAAARYERALAYSGAHGGVALLVVDGDAVVFARGARLARPIFSGVKGFLCPLAMAAVEDGKLALDAPAGPVSAAGEAVRVRDLLTMTSGLDEARWWAEVDGATTARVPKDRYAFAHELAVVQAPGKAFQYSGVHAAAFGAVMLGQHLDPRPFLMKRVLRPLGIRPARWASDGAGHAILTHGMWLSAESWARLGMLMRDDGVFLGRRLFEAGSLGACLAGSASMPAYGLGWWLNQPLTAVEAEQIPLLLREHLAMPRLFTPGPDDLFALLGSYGQRMYVVPSLGLVVVRLAKKVGDIDAFNDAEFLRALLR